MDRLTLAQNSLAQAIDHAAAALEPQLIAWRRDLHQHPELGNREFRTAGIVAAHLRALGLDEVKTGVAHTGVVGLLVGGKPGPVVALRADMDALPVAEEVDVPFASRARAPWNGEDCGVMHACGHDAHTAILMAVAGVLAGLRAQLAGSVKFIFQPAEERPPEGERGGAELMIEEGALRNPEPDAIFGLHVTSRLPTSIIGLRSGPLMASADQFRIDVRGRQTHGAAPWSGVDPIVTAAQVVLGLQTIVARQVDISREAAVVTVGAIKGGVRQNIIPDKVEMIGTIRAFDEGMREDIHGRIRDTAEASPRPRARSATCASSAATTSPSTTRSSPRRCCPRCAAWPAPSACRSCPRSPARRTSPATRRWCRACSSSSASPRRGRIRPRRRRITRRAFTSTNRGCCWACGRWPISPATTSRRRRRCGASSERRGAAAIGAIGGCA